MVTRAIYLPDARDHTMYVFELIDGTFVCIADNEIRYDINTVMSDNDWLVLSIDDDEIVNIR